MPASIVLQLVNWNCVMLSVIWLRSCVWLLNLKGCLEEMSRMNLHAAVRLQFYHQN